MACEKFFGADVDHYAVVNFKDVAMALNNGDADYGVLPIENSSAEMLQVFMTFYWRMMSVW